MGKILEPAGFTPQQGLAFDDGAGNATPVSGENPLPMAAGGSVYADVSIASLSSGQAAGTSTILAANTSRKALMINPPANCTLLIAAASGTPRGWPLFANVPNTITGQECPSNALYLIGLATGQSVGIWEA